MKRAQLLLEEWQYQVIRDISKKEKRSISSVVRELITEKITSTISTNEDSLFDAVGMLEGKGGAISENLDARIYKRGK